MPERKAFTKTADAFGPIIRTNASELPTSALFKPAFVSCPVKTEVKKVVPNTFNPEPAAFCNATSTSSPFHIETAKEMLALIPPAPDAIIVPFIVSNVRDSIVPAFAIFFA